MLIGMTSSFNTSFAMGSLIDWIAPTAVYLPGPLMASAIALAMIGVMAIFTRARKQGSYDHIPGPINKTNLGQSDLALRASRTLF